MSESMTAIHVRYILLLTLFLELGCIFGVFMPFVHRLATTNLMDCNNGVD